MYDSNNYQDDPVYEQDNYEDTIKGYLQNGRNTSEIPTYRNSRSYSNINN